jgi:hypothetical protein
VPRTLPRHINGIIWTASVDPFNNHIHDHIVFVCPRNQGAGGIDQCHGFRYGFIILTCSFWLPCNPSLVAYWSAVFLRSRISEWKRDVNGFDREAIAVLKNFSRMRQGRTSGYQAGWDRYRGRSPRQWVGFGSQRHFPHLSRCFSQDCAICSAYSGPNCSIHPRIIYLIVSESAVPSTKVWEGSISASACDKVSSLVGCSGFLAMRNTLFLVG